MADVDQLKKKYKSLYEAFRVDSLKTRVGELDALIASNDFWNDKHKAASVQKERSQLVQTIESFDGISSNLNDVEEFLPMANEPDIAKDIEEKLNKSSKELDQLEFIHMLGGPMDRMNAILSINSGAGGTEAQDWVSMLLRMYLRYAEKRGFLTETLDSLEGEGAGFKNVTVLIQGPYAYGYLKAEQGIHRLVRISPFDANARRHTSFASVSVLPEIEDEIAIEIRDEDIRTDTYRASGAGGQHVNKTDSAVRLTHLPSGIVVACQNERSQHKNRASAMKILKAKLYQREQEQRDKDRQALAGEKKDIAWGSQIRSYTLQPYQLIKDHRTDYETGNVQAVLDGQIEELIKNYLLSKASN